MENLTMRNSSGLVVPTKLNMEYISKMPLGDWDDWIEILDKLRDYEDTECSPEDVLKLLEMFEWVRVALRLCASDLCKIYKDAEIELTERQCIEGYLEKAVKIIMEEANEDCTNERVD